MQLGIGLGLNRLGRAGAAFSPIDIAGLAGWWDASDTSTITESGGSVSQWDDKSGNGRNVVQATAAAQPTTGVATQNGLNVLSFDGGDDLRNASPNLDSDLTFISVFKVNTATSFTMPGLMLGASSAGRPIDFYATSATRQTFIGTTSVSTSGTNFNTSHFSWSAWCLTYAKSTSASPRIVEFLNNSQTFAVTTGVVHSVASQTLSIGRRTDGATTLNGEIAELMLFDRIISADDRSALQTYLAAKWGL